MSPALIFKMGVTNDLEDRIVSVLKRLRDSHPDEHFGALLVVGYDPNKISHRKSVVHPMKGVDYFEGRELEVDNPEFERALYECMTGTSHDGAILINSYGLIIQNDTGLLFHPEAYLKARGQRGNNLAEQFGFDENVAKKVGARHLTAKGYSYEQGLVVITLSEETGHIRKFDRGYTVSSDIVSEVERIPVSRGMHLRYRRVG